MWWWCIKKPVVVDDVVDTGFTPQFYNMQIETQQRVWYIQQTQKWREEQSKNSVHVDI